MTARSVRELRQAGSALIAGQRADRLEVVPSREIRDELAIDRAVARRLRDLLPEALHCRGGEQNQRPRARCRRHEKHEGTGVVRLSLARKNEAVAAPLSFRVETRHARLMAVPGAYPDASVADPTPGGATAHGESEDHQGRGDDCDTDPEDGSTKNSLHDGRPRLRVGNPGGSPFTHQYGCLARSVRDPAQRCARVSSPRRRATHNCRSGSLDGCWPAARHNGQQGSRCRT